MSIPKKQRELVYNARGFRMMNPSLKKQDMETISFNFEQDVPKGSVVDRLMILTPGDAFRTVPTKKESAEPEDNFIRTDQINTMKELDALMCMLRNRRVRDPAQNYNGEAFLQYGYIRIFIVFGQKRLKTLAKELIHQESLVKWHSFGYTGMLSPSSEREVEDHYDFVYSEVVPRSPVMILDALEVMKPGLFNHKHPLNVVMDLDDFYRTEKDIPIFLAVKGVKAVHPCAKVGDITKKGRQFVVVGWPTALEDSRACDVVIESLQQLRDGKREPHSLVFINHKDFENGSAHLASKVVGTLHTKSIKKACCDCKGCALHGENECLSMEKVSKGKDGKHLCKKCKPSKRKRKDSSSVSKRSKKKKKEEKPAKGSIDLEEICDLSIFEDDNDTFSNMSPSIPEEKTPPPPVSYSFKDHLESIRNTERYLTPAIKIQPTMVRKAAPRLDEEVLELYPNDSVSKIII